MVVGASPDGQAQHMPLVGTLETYSTPIGFLLPARCGCSGGHVPDHAENICVSTRRAHYCALCRDLRRREPRRRRRRRRPCERAGGRGLIGPCANSGRISKAQGGSASPTPEDAKLVIHRSPPTYLDQSVMELCTLQQAIAPRASAKLRGRGRCFKPSKVQTVSLRGPAQDDSESDLLDPRGIHPPIERDLPLACLTLLPQRPSVRPSVCSSFCLSVSVVSLSLPTSLPPSYR